MTAAWAPGWIPGQQTSAFAAVAASRAITSADRYLEVNATTGSIVLPLPTAVGNASETFTFIRTDSATATNTVTITTTAGQTIGGATSQLLVFTGQILTVMSNGQNWLVCYSNYNGKELAYAETFSSSTSSNTLTGSATLSVNTIPGLALTVIGAGRAVKVEFVGRGYNAAAPDTQFGVGLLINGVTGDFDFNSNHVTGVGLEKLLFISRRIVLPAGLSHTFQIGMWTTSGTATFYADSGTPMPMSLAVIGQ